MDLDIQILVCIHKSSIGGPHQACGAPKQRALCSNHWLGSTRNALNIHLNAGYSSIARSTSDTAPLGLGPWGRQRGLERGTGLGRGGGIHNSIYIYILMCIYSYIYIVGDVRSSQYKLYTVKYWQLPTKTVSFAERAPFNTTNQCVVG